MGAGCPDRHVEYFQRMLTINGILVIPANDSHALMKITRITENTFESLEVSSVQFRELSNIPPAVPDVTSPDHHQRFVVDNDAEYVTMPTLGWSPPVHLSFPATFRQVAVSLLMASRRPRGLCGRVPLVLWLHIIGYASR